MSDQSQQSDRERAQAKEDRRVLARLSNRRTPATAAQLKTTTKHLRSLEGVVEVGSVKTGKAGRPAILFTTAEKAAEASANPSNSDAESQAIRAGDLSEVQA